MENLAARVLQDLRQRLQIDPEWIVRTDRGFTWWAGELAQHIWADEPIQRDDIQLTRVHIRTDVATGFDASAPQFEALGLLARYATMSGWIRDPADPTRLQLAAAVSVHEGAADFQAHLLSLAASIQVTEAHISMAFVAEVDGLEIAQSGHPTGGQRPDHDEMLAVIQAMPLRNAPSRWAGPAMLELLDLLERKPSLRVSGDETHITAELSHPETTASSWVRVSTNEQHPRLGSGCLFRVSTEVESEDDQSVLPALEANERELSIHNYFLGSWCPSDDGLTYVSFLPNVAYKRGLSAIMTMSLVNRARWASGELNDEHVSSDEHAVPADADVTSHLEYEDSLGEPPSVASSQRPSEKDDPIIEPEGGSNETGGGLSPEQFFSRRGDDTKRELAAAVQRRTVDQLGRASLPLAGLLLAGVIVGFSSGFGSVEAILLYLGAIGSAVAMFLYALPSVLVAAGHEKKLWMGLAAGLGLLPYLWSLYVIFVAGLWELLTDPSGGQLAATLFYILLGYWFLRSFSRLTELLKEVDAMLGRLEAADAVGSSQQ